MNGGCRWWRWIGSAVVVGAAALVSLAQPPRAPETGSKPADLEAAMKHAPEKAVGLIHVEVKALAKDLLAALAKDKDANGIFSRNVLEVLGRLAGRIDAIDVFLMPGEEGGIAPLAVLRGNVGVADINEALKLLPAGGVPIALKKQGKGRYGLDQEDSPVQFLVGGEMAELPAGVIVAGIEAMLTDEFVSGLGKGACEDLRKLLAIADTAAPVWLAVRVEKLTGDDDAPKTLVGGVYVLGGGRSKVLVDFKDANSADKFMKELTGAIDKSEMLSDILKPVLEVRRSGIIVTVSVKGNGSLVPTILGAMSKAGAATKKAQSASNLRQLGMGAMIYANDHDDVLAPDLQTIWKDSFSAKKHLAAVFVSPASGKEPKVDEKGNLAFEPDYVYLKYTMATAKIAQPAAMILAYERPENYKNEATYALFVDGHVEFLKIDEFNKKLKATKDWLAAQEKK